MKKLKDLNSDEIIIISVVIATFVALVLGYYFGETQYFHYTTNANDWGSDSHTSRYNKHTQKEFHFNYLLSIASFIILGGSIYLCLNRISKKNE